ncbi:Rieske (2Fe-2S) protein [Skermanella pratensis]|uniref:Rieske (2Fe-2S) protein n=1 Tax=Skermanella pratensis TaxID=2233999 RepID=UPI001300DBFC|nr:Rieske (2Fe-2S) protein [Skermanella pratensis]
MADRFTLGPLTGLPAGEGRTFKLGDRRVAVFRTRDGGVYATQATCPHRSGPLADGMLGGHALVCPLHDWMFDLKTGSSLNGACGIKTYAARVEPDGTVTVEVDDGEEVMAPPDVGAQHGATGNVATGAAAE